jgi:hypothetical protein
MPRGLFCIQSYRHRSLPVSAQRCLNWMAEMEPKDAKSPIVLLPTPGLVRFTQLPTGPVRGLRIMGSYLFAVSGVSVYRVDVAGAVLLLGNIADGTAVTMADNGTQLAIVVPETQQAWVATTTTLTQITAAAFGGASSVTAIDGYGVFTSPDSTQFFISALNDMTTFDALDFASAEGDPDNLVVARRVGRELWLFGERTTEIWADTGAADFPFQRISGAFVERGCVAQNSVAQRLAVPFWLGDDRCVYQGQGTQPQRISTHAVEQAIAGYGIVSDALGTIYEQEGHVFYCLSFPSENATWVYDMTTQVWHERESEGYGRWRVGHAVTFAGAVIGGDIIDGRLYVVNPAASDEDGDAIIRTATGSTIYSAGSRVAYPEMILDMETGTGLVTGQGSDPVITLSWSDDNGRNWSDGVVKNLGQIGTYQTRLKFNRLGSARNRTFRLQMSDPVRTSILGVDMTPEPMGF